MENNVTSSAHTAGPWEYLATVTGFTVYKSEENNHQCDHFTAALNDYNRVCAEGELEANARLIAAAPDLLEAAQFAYGVLCSLSYLKAVQKSDDYAELNRACDLLAIAANKTIGE